ncbi:MAG TPA: hypothetical protein EYQ26_10440 [Rhodospirillales bacterium]|nr:hypothetical protein [Rhodospirillales bacterium]
MATSIKAFNIELYQEHLEEASFLYEQRLGLLNDPELTWMDIDEFEQRLEAHIDALVVGEDLALEVCQTQAEEGDFGELFAAVCVFCRQNQAKRVADILDNLDMEDEERVQAVTDALKYECPHDWRNSLSNLFLRGHENSFAILAEMFGYCRFPANNALLRVMENAPDNSLVKITRSLGRLREDKASAFLLQLLRHEDGAVCSEALLALLRLGNLHAMKQSLLIAQSKQWPYSGLGLSGNQSAVQVLLDIVNSNKATHDCLIALGLLGDLAAVYPLVAQLENENCVGSAATALQLITGAELNEEVFIAEEIDEDELFEEELKAYKEEGKVPLRPEGEPFGTTEIRVSQDPEVWTQWLTENAGNFKRELRYRNGKPYSPVCLLENLQSERFVYHIRQLAYQELVIRYGMDIPFEADLLVRKQLLVLPKIASWVIENDKKFQPGQWYFAGKLIT